MTEPHEQHDHEHHDHEHHEQHDRRFDPAHAARLDAPERALSIPPAAIVAAAAVGPGAVVADVGSGTGYFLWPLVEAAGGVGTFYAVDCSTTMLERLRERARAHPLGRRVTPVLSDDDQLPLPDRSVDLVMIGSVYHELPARAAYLREVARVLRPGGRALVIDWRPLPPGAERTAGPPADHRLEESLAQRELEGAGLEVESLPAFEALWCLVGTRRR